MTVSTTDSVEEYVSGGPDFPISYRFLQNSDIEVVLIDQDGVSETLVLGTQYTLTGAGSQNGGTLTSAYAASVLATPGAVLSISRVMDVVQPTDLRNQGRFLAETHETAFDRMTMLIQQGFTGLTRALLRPIGKNYYDALGRQIRNIAMPEDLTDAATVDWAQKYIASILETGQGPINNAANIVYAKPGGAISNVQGMSGAGGTDYIGYGSGTLTQKLSQLDSGLVSASDNLSKLDTKVFGYKQAAIASGALNINAAEASTFGVILNQNVSVVNLTGAVDGEKKQIDFIFSQPATGYSVTFPISVKRPIGSSSLVSSYPYAVTFLSLTTVDGGETWLANTPVFYDNTPATGFPLIPDNNATFNDEGSSATGWTPSNATISVSGSRLRQTKVASGSNSSMSKPIPTFTPSNSDYCLYGKARCRGDSGDIGVIWLLNGSKEASIWFGSATANGTYSAGAISIAGTTGASTRAVQQVAASANYTTQDIDFCLQFDQKFKTLTCWFRETDGRWKWRGRVACDWFSSDSIQVLTATSSSAGCWVEIDHLTLAKPNVVVLSDSIGEGKTLYSPDPALNLTNDESTWMRHAVLYPSLRNNLVVNKGVGGNTSAQILSRVGDSTSTGARVTILQASSNDEAAGVSQPQRTTNIQGTVNALTGAGQNVVLTNAMYATATASDNTPPRALKDYAKQWWENGRFALTGVSSYVDIMQAVKSSGTDFMDPTKTQSDGIHPNIVGHTAIGAQMQAAQ